MRAANVEDFPFEPEAQSTDAPQPQLWAKPYIWRPAADIPRRQFLYGRHLIRRFLSTTVAPGGVGKSALELAEALAMVSGKPLLGVTPVPGLVVWYWNGEDPAEETERRISAATLNYGLSREDLEGRLFVGTGRDADLVIAEQTRDGTEICRPHVDALTTMIRDLRIDVVIIDPFISSHRVTENDNNAIERVAKTWARIAEDTSCAVELVHHTRKDKGGSEVTVEDGRGAVALLAAARSARVLNPMTTQEAERAGVEAHRSYFRVDNGKANLAPPSEKSDWHRFLSVDLGNGGGLHQGDNVGVVTVWEWPDVFEGMKATHLLAAQHAVAAGRWRENVQAKDWVGHAIAKALNLDLGNKRDRAKVRGLISRWLDSGALARVNALDSKRMERTFIEVGEWASDTVETFQ